MIFLLFVSLVLWALWSTYSLIVYRKKSIAHKTVLVTGGSSEIGRCLVLRLLELECKVVVWGSKKNELRQLSKEARALLDEKSKDEKDGKKQAQEIVWNFGEGGTFAGRFRLFGTPTNPLLTIVHVSPTNASHLQRLVKRLPPVDIAIFASDPVDKEAFLDRTEESSEQVLQLTALVPLLLTRALFPPSPPSPPPPGASAAAGAIAIATIVDASALAAGSAAHADFAAAQWAAAGAHESARRILRGRRGESSSAALVCAWPRRSAAGGGATAEEVAEGCIEAVRTGVDRVFIPSVMVLFPLLRILPVPWFLCIMQLICRGDKG